MIFVGFKVNEKETVQITQIETRDGTRITSLDSLSLHLESFGSELDANSGFRFQTKLVSGEPRENIRFSNSRIADQNDLEKVIVLVIYSLRHFPSLSLSLSLSLEPEVDRSRRENNQKGRSIILENYTELFRKRKKELPNERKRKKR